MKIEIDVEIPDGWEFVRYGHARHRDWFLDHGSKVVQWNMSPSFRQYIILRRKRPEFVTLENVPYHAVWSIANMDWPAGYWKQIGQACRAALAELEAQHDSDN